MAQGIARAASIEFGLQRLDRAAKFAGEVFGVDEEALDVQPARDASMLPWLAVAVLAVAGLVYLIR